MSAIFKTVIAVMVIGVVFLAGIAANAQEPLQPKIYMQKMRHDYGKTYPLEKYEHTFVVQNKGKADLIIDNVKPG